MIILNASHINRETVIQAMVRLEREVWGKRAWSEHAIREELDAPARTYLLAVDMDAADNDDSNNIDADNIIAYAGYWYDGDDAEVMNIDVTTTRQNQGVGRTLFNHMIANAREQGAKRMLLEVSVENAPALALYQKLGFTRMGLRKRYYQPEGIDAYTMSLDLSPRIVGFAPTGAQTGNDDNTNQSMEQQQ